MTAHSPSDAHDSAEQLPDWVYRLGLHEPDRCAARLAQSLVDEPFDVIGFTAVAASYFGAEFGDMVDRLAGYEPALRTALPAVAAAMHSLVANEHLPDLHGSECAALPQWLREIDKCACSGMMRRFDHADRSSSSYLIEARLAGGHVATARLSIAHADVDRVSELWTTAFSLRDAAQFYRKRYALLTTSPYRHVEQETGRHRIGEAVLGSLSSGRLVQDRDAPIPWPQNAAVLNLMLRPALALVDSDDA